MNSSQTDPMKFWHELFSWGGGRDVIVRDTSYAVGKGPQIPLRGTDSIFLGTLGRTISTCLGVVHQHWSLSVWGSLTNESCLVPEMGRWPSTEELSTAVAAEELWGGSRGNEMILLPQTGLSNFRCLNWTTPPWSLLLPHLLPSQQIKNTSFQFSQAKNLESSLTHLFPF